MKSAFFVPSKWMSLPLRAGCDFAGGGHIERVQVVAASENERGHSDRRNHILDSVPDSTIRECDKVGLRHGGG
jgi:hypothetical protein